MLSRAAIKPGRIRETYSPVPNAAEKRHHLRLIELPCCCGCGAEPCGIVHHVLGYDHLKRWRRDHRFVVPIFHLCHTEAHKGEAAFEARHGINLGEIAQEHELASVYAGIL